jgi:hypothetical protein
MSPARVRSPGPRRRLQKAAAVRAAAAARLMPARPAAPRSPRWRGARPPSQDPPPPRPAAAATPQRRPHYQVAAACRAAEPSRTTLAARHGFHDAWHAARPRATHGNTGSTCCYNSCCAPRPLFAALPAECRRSSALTLSALHSKPEQGRRAASAAGATAAARCLCARACLARSLASECRER